MTSSHTAPPNIQSHVNAPAGQFTYCAPPSVTGVSPNSGGGNTSVTISGTNFSTALGATSFYFAPSGGSASAGNEATNMSCTSTTQCSASAPSSSGTVDVLASFFGQPSAAVTADHFTYTLKLGDVNGSVTSVDALCVLRMVVSLPGTTACSQPPPGNPIIANGETNGPTSVDALCILRGVAGLPATSTCPQITAP